MKYYPKFLILISCLLLQIAAFAQDTYYVIHVKGNVTITSTGKALKIGDKISLEDKVTFSASDAAAVIMGPKGKFTLTPTASANNNSSELTAFVKSTMLPVKSNGHLSTRGEEGSGVSDLKGYFGNSTFVIIGDKHSVNLNPNKYQINDKQFFVYRYTYEGTVVSKKISSSSNTLIIDKQSLYTYKGNSIDPEKVKVVEIYYTNTSTNNSQKITSFNPVYLNENTLKEELTVQKKLLKEQKKTEDEIKKEFLNYILDIYGKTDEKIFNEWVKNNVK